MPNSPLPMKRRSSSLRRKVRSERGGRSEAGVGALDDRGDLVVLPGHVQEVDLHDVRALAGEYDVLANAEFARVLLEHPGRAAVGRVVRAHNRKPYVRMLGLNQRECAHQFEVSLATEKARHAHDEW